MPLDFRPSASKANLEARGQTLALVREFFANRQVLEVQTPLLGSATVTDPAVNALVVYSPSAADELQGYLQTSTEYHQKRLLAAGIGDNYTLGPVFRADEQGRLHSSEFTMLEWYRLGFDDHALMAELCELVDLLLGPASYQSHTYAALLAQAPEHQLESSDSSGLDTSAVTARDLEDLRLALAIESLGAGRHFVVDYPKTSAVLARVDDSDPSIARRFELVIDGIEVANGYFELTDATIHRTRFADDNAERAARGLPQIAVDQAFMASVDAGLPACAGVAVGVDRLLMLKLGVESIDEVQSFGGSRR